MEKISSSVFCQLMCYQCIALQQKLLALIQLLLYIAAIRQLECFVLMQEQASVFSAQRAIIQVTNHEIDIFYITLLHDAYVLFLFLYLSSILNCFLLLTFLIAMQGVNITAVWYHVHNQKLLKALSS
jgi:hypothetical protein